MRQRTSLAYLIRLAFLVTLAAALGAPALAQGPTAEECVGMDAPDFSLPSQQDRLVDYERDYYGKHNLILTFFPAAFTPV